MKFRNTKESLDRGVLPEGFVMLVPHIRIRIRIHININNHIHIFSRCWQTLELHLAAAFATQLLLRLAHYIEVDIVKQGRNSSQAKDDDDVVEVPLNDVLATYK